MRGAITGLLLNHGTWGMAHLQRSRTTSTSTHQVTLPASGDTLRDAQALMRQLPGWKRACVPNRSCLV